MHCVRSKPFAGFLLNPFGMHPREIVFSDGRLNFIGKHQKEVHLPDLVSEPKVTKGLFGSTVSISTDDGAQNVLKAARQSEASSFAEAVRVGWIACITKRFEPDRVCRRS